MQVQQRIGMAPLTRLRASDDRIPTPLMKEYYGQRASVPGTLIISEGTFISAASCGGFARAPGIWRDDQIDGWKAITNEVHRNGCFIFCQLFHMGRAGDFETAKKDGYPLVAPSAVGFDGGETPLAMTLEEIQEMIQDFVEAAKNAIRAGFDGVEVHGANGYLLDQFIQDVSNKREDLYGGSIENRSRAVVNVLEAVSKAIGPERVGLRLSPWSTFQGMRVADPVPQFSDIIIKARSLSIAYLHLVESRISGANDYNGHEQLDFAYKLWNSPLLVAGGYTPQEAAELVDERYSQKDIVVLFGRYFISNPDLITRIKRGLQLNQYDRNTFYSPGASGYVDYSCSTE